MNDINLPPPAGLMDCGQGFVEVWTASQITAAVLAERERCVRIVEETVRMVDAADALHMIRSGGNP